MSYHEHGSAAIIDPEQPQSGTGEVTVEGIVSAAVEYYGRSLEELVTYEQKDLELIDARSAIVGVMSGYTQLSSEEMAEALGTNGRKIGDWQRIINRRSSEDPRVKEHIDELARAAAGEPLVNTPAAWLQLAAAHSNVTQEELIAKRTRSAIEAHQMGAHLLSENTVLRPGGIARRTGYVKADNVAYATRIIHARSRDEVDFAMDLSQLEQGDLPGGTEERRPYIADKAERDRAARKIMKTVFDFYGVKSREVLSKSFADKTMRPRKVAAYLLAEKLGLSEAQIAEKLKRRSDTVQKLRRRIDQEIADDPLVAAEVEYLRDTKKIKNSVNERIINGVAEVTGVDRDSLMAAEGPQAMKARSMVMVLMAERGHFSTVEIGKFFGLASEHPVFRAKTVILHELQNNSLLQQQLDWIRGGLLTEELPGPFVFADNPADGAPEDQAVIEANQLPDIDESLVHPGIKAKIYEIVEETAAFYNVPAIDVLGRSDDFLVARARRAALLRCRQSRMPIPETAICFDARVSKTVTVLANHAAEEEQEHRVFAEELEAIAAGEQRRDVLSETLSLVSGYYGIPASELRSSKTARAVRAKSVFLTVMAELACEDRDRLSEASGYVRAVTSLVIAQTAQRLKDDPRLRAEVEYFKNPGTAVRPPNADDIVFKVRSSFGLSMEELTRPRTEREHKAKRLAAYILAEETMLITRDIAKILRSGNTTVSKGIETTREEVSRSPREALEVDALKPLYSVSFSVTSRIMRYVAERNEVGITALVSGKETPKLVKARREAARLLVRKASYAPDKTADLLGIPQAHVERLAA